MSQIGVAWSESSFDANINYICNEVIPLELLRYNGNVDASLVVLRKLRDQ